MLDLFKRIDNVSISFYQILRILIEKFCVQLYPRNNVNKTIENASRASVQSRQSQSRLTAPHESTSLTMASASGEKGKPTASRDSVQTAQSSAFMGSLGPTTMLSTGGDPGKSLLHTQQV